MTNSSSNGYDEKPSERENKKNTNQLKRNLIDVPQRQFAEYLYHVYTALTYFMPICKGDVTCKLV